MNPYDLSGLIQVFIRDTITLYDKPFYSQINNFLERQKSLNSLKISSFVQFAPQNFKLTNDINLFI